MHVGPRSGVPRVLNSGGIILQHTRRGTHTHARTQYITGVCGLGTAGEGAGFMGMCRVGEWAESSPCWRETEARIANMHANLTHVKENLCNRIFKS